MLLKSQHYNHFEPQWDTLQNHDMDNGFVLKSNVQTFSDSSILNDNKYDDLKKIDCDTQSTQKFTNFTIDHILAPKSYNTKIENELHRRSSLLSAFTNPIRPIPVQAMPHPSLQLPSLNNASANNFNSSGLFVGDYQNFIRNCQKSADFDQSDQRFWNSGAPKDLTPQMNVNNVCAPIPHQLLADFTSMSQKSQPKRNRRHRTVFTDKQLRLLEAAFNKTLYPDVILRQKLAETMNLKEEHVHVWFKNRRAKLHKSQSEGTTSRIRKIQPNHLKRKNLSTNNTSSNYIQNISNGLLNFSSYREVDDSLSSSSSSSDDLRH